MTFEVQGPPWPRMVNRPVLAEQHDEWAEARRHLGLDVLARARVTAVPDTTEEATTNDIPALSA